MDEEQGGFLRPSLLSPKSSLASSSAATTRLPHPREHPLKSGSAKESSLIRFLDEHIIKMQRRFARRVTEPGMGVAPTDAVGYKSFAESVKDFERLIDLLWLSGTPSLQVPYLLSVALLVTQYLPSFEPSPKATFRLLDKLDLAFASLLQGRHVETGEPLPGFEGGRTVSVTEKVRLKSLVDQTRLCVVNVMSGGDGTEMGDDETDYLETDDDDDDDGDDNDDNDMNEMDNDHSGAIDRKEMAIARVYDRTVVELGDVLGGSPIGIITSE